MRRVVLSIVLAIALSVGVTANPRPSLLDSVRALSWTDIVDFDGTTAMSNHCTVWSLNDHKGYWVTAGHCVISEDGNGVENRDYHIGSAIAVPIAADFSHDIAVLRSSALAPALPLGQYGPTWNDAVYSAGHTLGWDEPLYFEGKYLGSEKFPEFDGRRFLIFSLAGGPGNSGSPILHDGQVISVWQIGFTVFGSFAGGVETESMYSFLAPYAAE